MSGSPFVNALLASVVWGVAPLMEKRVLGTSDPMASVLWRVVGTGLGGLLLLPFVPNARASMAQVGPRGAAMLALAGALASVLGQVFMYAAMKRSEVSRVSPIAGSWPLVVFLLSWIVLGEAMTWRKAAGCALVVSGVWLLKLP